MTVYPNNFRSHHRRAPSYTSMDFEHAQELVSKIFQECMDIRCEKNKQNSGSKKIASMKELKENWHKNKLIYNKLLTHAEDFHIETCAPLLRLYMSLSLVEDLNRLLHGGIEHSSMTTILNEISWLLNHVDVDTL